MKNQALKKLIEVALKHNIIFPESIFDYGRSRKSDKEIANDIVHCAFACRHYNMEGHNEVCKANDEFYTYLKNKESK